MLEFWDEIDHRCNKCNLHTKIKTPFMPISGEGKQKILIVGDLLSNADDRAGFAFSGKDGNLLNTHLNLLGYSLDTDFYLTTAIRCAKTNNAAATETEIKCCHHKLEETIKQLKPIAIFAMGSTALKLIFQGIIPKQKSIASLSGTMIPHREFNTWVFPIFNPLWVLQKSWEKNRLSCFKRELKNALMHCKKLPKLPTVQPYDKVKILLKSSEAIAYLKTLLKKKPLTAFDYETSGLKPYRKGHTIYSIGISTKNLAYSFQLKLYSKKPKDRKIIQLVKQYLADKKMKKICHNAQYEYIWSTVLLVKPKGIIWCTMITQHMLDNRRGITGLKHQIAVRWGLYGYEKGMSQYITSAIENDPHSMNRMHEAPIPALLLYNGTDAYWTMQLYLLQIKEVPIKMKLARKFFHMGALLFARMSLIGVCVDVVYYAQKSAELQKEIIQIEEEINESQEIAKYNRMHDKAFKSTSYQHLGKLFYDVLQLKVNKETTSGGRSVDEDALNKINHWIAKAIVRKRKLIKLQDYIGQIVREEINGKIHTSLTLHIARTFRSSSLGPNTQNWPKRNEVAMQMIRTGIIPFFDRIIEPDFSSAEVITAAAYNKDPNLIAYLKNPNSDMHRDMACDLYKAKDSWITKLIRTCVKSATFGFFYGSFFKQVAQGMLEINFNNKFTTDVTVGEHLKKLKLSTPKQFEKHVQKVEKIFWFDRFNVYRLWKNKINEEYRKTGEIWTFLGFRFIGYMDEKQVSNYPIQGTSFHLLLYSLIIIEMKLNAAKLKTKVCLEVHDSGIFDAPEKEVDQVVQLFKNVTSHLKTKFPWLSVDMKADADVSEINGNFANMKKYK